MAGVIAAKMNEYGNRFEKHRQHFRTLTQNLTAARSQVASLRIEADTDDETRVWFVGNSHLLRLEFGVDWRNQTTTCLLKCYRKDPLGESPSYQDTGNFLIMTESGNLRPGADKPGYFATDLPEFAIPILFYLLTGRYDEAVSPV